MVVALVLCLTVSMIANIAMGFLWADDKVMIKQMGEHNRELWTQVNNLDESARFWMAAFKQSDLGFVTLCDNLRYVSISRRDERGRFCGRVTVGEIVRGEV